MKKTLNQKSRGTVPLKGYRRRIFGTDPLPHLSHTGLYAHKFAHNCALNLSSLPQPHPFIAKIFKFLREGEGGEGGRGGEILQMTPAGGQTLLGKMVEPPI
jgi:hypothetical protein